MNNTIPFHSAPHAPQITVDVNILTMLKQAASCLTEAAGRDVYLAAIGPDMELTIIMEEDAPSVLPCFDEDDALISVKGAPLFISYNPAQVLKLAGKRYLTGPVIFYRTDGHSTIVSLTVEDIYRFQTYLESHSTTLMADGQKLTCICIEKIHPHMFRHTFVSILLSNPNIGVATVAAEAGHAQPSTTLAIYTQVYDRRRDEIRKQMSRELYK